MPKQPEIACVVLTLNDEYWLPYALKASEGFFERYVIYDVGSTDMTPNIIKWFAERNKGKVECFVRQFPEIPHPTIQGAFRNSMFAEARSEWIFMLDADEIYPPKAFTKIIKEVPNLTDSYKRFDKIYGVVPRVEVCEGLNLAYGLNHKVPHHRIYHRTAVFCGPHPGEWPLYKQKLERENHFREPVRCFHFHNTARSRHDEIVPKRIERRSKSTYHPGEREPLNLLEALPILCNKIENFPVNPVLERLQHG